ncbi:MAG: Putative ATP-binding protein [uncultured Sulfurovum sp.]|uniref:ATP-binding protein n=1 Tax=uncultured Sulfurovum sp. TaxID=269237 RepID=A0A6S6T8E7_9BACT|nr:MAG: Putative ATP-binding protein [uncultured Sulfurovum sp.]
MKLRKLHIEDHKMFKDFDIDFVDENDKVLPIVVLAGVNGSGKTTLLDSLGKTKQEQHLLKLENYTTIEIRENDNIEFTYDNLKQDLNLDIPNKFFMFYADNIVYFSAGIDDTKKVADEFVKTFYFYLKEKDYRPSEITEYFNQYMKDIFNDLDIGFKYSHLDKEDKVWFTSDDGDGYYYTDKDNEEKVLFTIDELSTGQKTLLSKILYIYFKDYKDKVILIDEPELSLHPKWQSQVLSIYEKLAEKNNCQIIIATHSPHIIGSAKPEYLRVLKKVDNKIEVAQYTQSYGLEFSQILTDIMDVEYLRTPEVAKKMAHVKLMIIENSYDSDEFKKEWDELENMLGKNYLDLKLLKLEIASRRKSASNK